MVARFVASFSIVGLFMGLLFLCASLTPSLLPRVPQVQGVLGGLAFAVGYGVGRGLRGFWWLLEFKDISGSPKRIITWILALALSCLTVFTFSRSAVWQNSIRDRMEMPDVESAYPWMVAGIAFITALALIIAVRGVIRLARALSAVLANVLPRRSAIGLGTILAVLLIYIVVNDFVVQRALRAVDTLAAAIDRNVKEGVEPPTHGFASGGPASGIAWADIGSNGKRFLTRGPGRAEIAEFSGQQAMEPIRVYAGYGTGKDFKERAAFALEDLINLGGFERSVLIIATPTGTGWLDPAAVEPLAFLHGGDLAIVSLQYSYVPSWLSILVEPDRSRLAARALYDAVYEHWTKLTEGNRPRVYLFGLSLGALGSETSADAISLINDPVDGALWSGPPFPSTNWGRLMANRNVGSPARLPEFRDGSIIRFMNQDGIATPDGAEWGRLRLIYMQYASDPMVFFSPSLAFKRPEWLGEDRGRDVSPYFDWYPLVTFLQVGFDIPMATSAPSGYGHTYNARDYIDGWIEVTEPDRWSTKDTERLKEMFSDFQASPI